MVRLGAAGPEPAPAASQRKAARRAAVSGTKRALSNPLQAIKPSKKTKRASPSAARRRLGVRDRLSRSAHRSRRLASGDSTVVPTSSRSTHQSCTAWDQQSWAGLRSPSRNLQLTTERPPACDLLPAGSVGHRSFSELVLERELRHQACVSREAMPRRSTQVMPRIVTSTMSTSPHARQRATRPGPRM